MPRRPKAYTLRWYVDRYAKPTPAGLRRVEKVAPVQYLPTPGEDVAIAAMMADLPGDPFTVEPGERAA